jgi:hypothetical protein
MLTQLGVQEPGTPAARHAYGAAVLAACLVGLDEPSTTLRIHPGACEAKPASPELTSPSHQPKG